MPRQRRPYLPGCFFHVTARTQGRVAWFDEGLRDVIADKIEVVRQRCDASVAAFVIMPNHFHLVLRQGREPISRFMQPLLTNVARAVRVRHKVEGHIFGRRYWDHQCATLDYLQTCVAYIHHNPVKAEMCCSAAEYRWSSHANYTNAPAQHPVKVTAYVPAAADDFALGLRAHMHTDAAGTRAADMFAIVTGVLRRLDPPIQLDLLRNARGHAATSVRRLCIEAAALAGFRNTQIAAYLKISEATVSKVVVELRRVQQISLAYANRPKIEG